MKKALKIFGVIAVLALIVVGGVIKSKQGSAIEVDTTKVIKGSLKSYTEEIGEVKIRNSEDVFTKISGKVLEVKVEVGGFVKKGDILAKIDSQDQEQDIQILQAQKAALLAQYKESTKAAEPLEIKKLQATIGNMELKYQETQNNLIKGQELYNNGAITEQELASIKISAESEKNDIAKLKMDLELLKKPASSNIINNYQAQLNQLSLQIEALENNKGEYTIYAPIDGTILEKNISKGAFTIYGNKLFSVGNTADLYIEAEVLAEDIVDIYPGMKAEVTNQSMNDIVVKGEVLKIYPQAYSKMSELGVEQKRIKVEITIKDDKKILKPGFDMDVKFIKQEKNQTLIIPENAVFKMNNIDYVFVVEDKKAKLRQVETGIESDRNIEILKGLKENEMVINSPDKDINEGVTIIEKNSSKIKELEK